MRRSRAEFLQAHFESAALNPTLSISPGCVGGNSLLLEFEMAIFYSLMIIVLIGLLYIVFEYLYRQMILSTTVV